MPSLQLKSVVFSLNPGRWNYQDSDAPFQNTNGVEAWVYALRGDYRGPGHQETKGYELIVANLNPELISTYQRLQDTKTSNTKWVTLIEGAGEDYLDDVEGIRSVLDRSDLVAVINRHTLPFFSMLTKSPCILTGVPYPVDYMRSQRLNFQDRRREIFLCPRKHRVPTALVAKSIGLPVCIYGPKLSRKVSNLKTFLREGSISKGHYLDKLSQELAPLPVRAEFESGLEAFFHDVRGCKYWVNLDPRFTWARFVLDGAALGTPVISTRSTVHSQDIFPKLTVENVFQVDQALQMARQLEDKCFWQEVVEIADEKLQDYSYESVANKLLAAISA